RQRHGDGAADEPLLPEPPGGATGAERSDAEGGGFGGGKELAADVAPVGGAEARGTGDGRRRARQGASSTAPGADRARNRKGRTAVRPPLLLGRVRPGRRQGLKRSASGETARR